MKCKYNFSVLKNKQIGFETIINNKSYIFSNTLKDVKIKNDNITFIFENTFLVIKNDVFLHLRLYEINNTYIFKDFDNKIVNCLLGFTMFDTFGFPIDLTKEILEEKGYLLDTNGFEILRNLNKQKSRENSTLSSAFK